MENKIILLESEIDAEILNFIMNNEKTKKRNFEIEIFLNSQQLSCKQRDDICKHLDEFWLKELEEEGIISASKKYHFSIKSYTKKKSLVKLKSSYYFDRFLKRFS